MKEEMPRALRWNQSLKSAPSACAHEKYSDIPVLSSVKKNTLYVDRPFTIDKPMPAFGAEKKKAWRIC